MFIYIYIYVYTHTYIYIHTQSQVHASGHSNNKKKVRTVIGKRSKYHTLALYVYMFAHMGITTCILVRSMTRQKCRP